jgi:hypothetical protein
MEKHNKAGLTSTKLPQSHGARFVIYLLVKHQESWIFEAEPQKLLTMWGLSRTWLREIIS